MGSRRAVRRHKCNDVGYARAVARKEYEDRRRRQALGIAKDKADAVYRGRPEKIARYEGIAGMLRGGMSWTAIQAAAGCSRATIAKVARRAAAAA
jgi:DNA invertase Pin-like site-specific DNA recombinase